MELDAEQLRRPWWQQPSMSMLLALLISLVLYPFAEHSRAFRIAAQSMDIAAVLMVVRAVRAHAVWWRSGWVFALPLVLLQVAVLLRSSPSSELLLLWAQVAFHGYATLVLLAYVMRDDVVTIDELFAIASMYILVALLWASAYALVVHADPNAIFINSTNNLDGVVSYADLVYFSMTTLTSVGYGEITPVSPAARALAMLQQVFGILFVAIVIARMTGMYVRRGAGRGR